MDARGAGHQGCDQTWMLVEDRFWWPRAREDITQAVKNCMRWITYEGKDTQVPLVSVVATSPPEIVHMDHTSFETTNITTQETPTAPIKPESTSIDPTTGAAQHIMVVTTFVPTSIASASADITLPAPSPVRHLQCHQKCLPAH